MGENVDVSEEHQEAVSQVEEVVVPTPEASVLASSKDAPLTGQPIWEVEMVRQQGSLTAAFHSVPTEEEEETEDLRQGKDGGEEERLTEEEVRTVRHDYECVMTASLADELDKSDEDLVLSQSLSGSVRLSAQTELSVPPTMQVQEQSELFEPQTLQTVVTGCEIPDQRTALEGSQVGKRVSHRNKTTGGVCYSFS